MGNCANVIATHDAGRPPTNPRPTRTVAPATTAHAAAETSSDATVLVAHSRRSGTPRLAKKTLELSRPTWLSAIAMPRNARGNAYSPRPIGPSARAMTTVAAKPTKAARTRRPA